MSTERDPVHLTRERHDAGTDVWCAASIDANAYAEGATTLDPDEATCVECLHEARAYGQRAFQRAERLRRGIA